MAQLVTFSDGGFRNALVQLAEVTRKDFSEIVRRQGRLLAIQLARVTQPFGGGGNNESGNYVGEGDRIAGEKATRRDIYKLYAPPYIAFQQIRDTDFQAAQAFWRAIQDSDWTECERIVREAGGRWRNVPVGRFDAGLHRRNRNRQGRISRHVPAQIVTNPKALSTYAEKKVKLVGLAKGGCAAAAPMPN